MSSIVQPALIIGVGGSGTDIVRRFRRRLRSVHADTPYVRCLGIDTAPQTAAREHLPQLPDDEFVFASNFRMDHYTSPGFIDQHPAIRSWWRGYEGLPARYVNAGAGMKRPIGRLALFVNHDAVMKRMRALLSAMFASEVFFDLPPQYRKAVNIYIVSSTCGGTGTGMFLDLAYLASHVVSQQFNAEPWVRGLLLLPSTFIGTGQVNANSELNLRLNAFGALTELDYAMSKTAQLKPVLYPDGQEVSRAGEPFRSCYLVGNQAAAGAVFGDFEDLQERAAVHIHTELASELSATGAAAMDNVLQAIAVKPDAQGKRRLFSSFNGEWLELESARVISRWTRRLALDTLERLARASESAEQNSTGALSESQGYGSLRTLFSASGVNPYLPRVDSFLDVFMDVGKEGRSPDELIQNAHALQGEAQRQISTTQVAELVREAVGSLLPEIKLQNRRILARQSLFDAKRFLTDVRSELAGWLARAQNETGGAASDSWVMEFSHKASTHKKGLLGSQNQYASTQRQLVIDAAESARAAWQKAIRARIAEQVVVRVPSLLSAVDELREETQVALDLIENAIARMRRRRDPEPPPASGQRSVSDEDIDTAYSVAGRPERLRSAVERELQELLTGQRMTAEVLEERVWGSAHSAVLQVAPEYLQTISIPAADIARRLDSSSPLAVFTSVWPAQPYSRDVDPLWLIGLPPSMQSQRGAVEAALSAANREKTQIVPLGDEDRVVITVQNHGFPLYALQESADCKRAYETATADQRVLAFVQPEDPVRTWDLMPVSPLENHRLFALAMALGKIRRAGQSYLYRQDGAGGMDIDLGSSPDPVAARQAARDAFLSAGYGSLVRQAIDQRVRREGNAPLHAALSEWLKQQEQFERDPAFPSDFGREVTAVREFLTTIPPY